MHMHRYLLYFAAVRQAVKDLSTARLATSVVCGAVGAGAMGPVCVDHTVQDVSSCAAHAVTVAAAAHDDDALAAAGGGAPTRAPNPATGDGGTAAETVAEEGYGVNSKGASLDATTGDDDKGVVAHKAASVVAVVIGPGRGRLVTYILEACDEEGVECKVLCVETNSLAMQHLQSRFAGENRVTLVHAALRPDDTAETLPHECLPFLGVSNIFFLIYYSIYYAPKLP